MEILTGQEATKFAFQNVNVKSLSLIDSKDKPLYGIYKGEVIDNKDPEKYGRCRVRVFGIFDGLDNGMIPWANPRMFYVGSTPGNFIVPPEGTEVHVEFENGDIYAPLYSTKVLSRRSKEAVKSGLVDEDYPNTQVLYETDQGEYYKINTQTGVSEFRHKSGALVRFEEEGNIIVDNTPSLSGKIIINTNRNIDIQSEANLNILTSGHTTIISDIVSIKGRVLTTIEGNLAISGHLHVAKDFYGKHTHLGNYGMKTTECFPPNQADFPQTWIADDNEAIDAGIASAFEDLGAITTDDFSNATGERENITPLETLRTDYARIVTKILGLTNLNKLKESIPPTDENKNDKSSLFQIIEKYDSEDGNELITKWLTEEIKDLQEQIDEDDENDLYRSTPVPPMPYFILVQDPNKIIASEDNIFHTYKLEFINTAEPGISKLPVVQPYVIIKPIQWHDNGVEFYLQFETHDGGKHHYIQYIKNNKELKDAYGFFCTKSEFDDASKAVQEWETWSEPNSIDEFARTSNIYS